MNQKEYVDLAVGLGLGAAVAKVVEHLLTLRRQRREEEDGVVDRAIKIDDTEKESLRKTIALLRQELSQRAEDVKETRVETKDELRSRDARIAELETCIAGLRGLGTRHGLELFLLRKERKEVFDEMTRALEEDDVRHCCELLRELCGRLRAEIVVPELE